MEKAGSSKLVDSKRSWCLLAVAFLSLFGVSGLQLSFGTILAALVHEYGESKSKTAWVGSLVTLFTYVLSPLTISISRRLGIRLTQQLGGLFLTVGIITTSFASHIDYMFFTYGVLVGMGTALINAPVYAIIPELFEKYVAIAIGITSSGGTLGLIFFSYLLPKLLSQLGWRQTLWVVATLGPLISVGGLTFPAATVIQSAGATEVHMNDVEVGKVGCGSIEVGKVGCGSIEVGKVGCGSTIVHRQPWWKCLKRKAFVLWSIVIVTYGLAELIPLYLVPICAQEAGIPASYTKWFNIIFGIGCFFGKLASGSAAQPFLKRDQCKYIYIVVLFIYSLASFLVSLNYEFRWLALYMALIGLLEGVVCSLYFIVTLEIVGIDNYPNVCGLVLSMSGISLTTGPPLAGLLYENFPAFQNLLLTICATTLVAAIVMALVPCFTPRKLYTLHQTDYDYWRVYCNNPNVSPILPRQQPRPFTVQDARRGIMQTQVKLDMMKDSVIIAKTVSQTCLMDDMRAAG